MGYHQVSPQRSKRYLGEFDFRYNERMALGVSLIRRTPRKAIKGIAGKRLTYHQPDNANIDQAQGTAFFALACSRNGNNLLWTALHIARLIFLTARFPSLISESGRRRGCEHPSNRRISATGDFLFAVLLAYYICVHLRPSMPMPPEAKQQTPSQLPKVPQQPSSKIWHIFENY